MNTWKRIRVGAMVALVTVLVFVLACTDEASAPTISGQWTGSAAVGSLLVDMTFQMDQEGSNVTGTYQMKLIDAWTTSTASGMLTGTYRYPTASWSISDGAGNVIYFQGDVNAGADQMTATLSAFDESSQEFQLVRRRGDG